MYSRPVGAFLRLGEAPAKARQMIRKAFILFFGAVAAIAGAESNDFVKDKVLVKFTAGASFQKAVAIESLGASAVIEFADLGWTVVKLPKDVTVQGAIGHFKDFGAVLAAEPNYIRKPFFTPNDTDWTQQYAPKKIKAEQGWDIDKGSPNVIIAIIDTGVDLTHPDLQGKLVPGYDFSDNDSDPSDYTGHGTHCAGNAAAATNNAKGVAGIAYNCKIMPLKIFPNATVENVIKAVKYAADHGAKVCSMSFGGAAPSQAEEDAMNYAFNKGVLLVAAAGNNGTTEKFWPAAYTNVLAVAATDQNDKKASFSTYGDWVEVAAPGVAVRSTYMGGGYANMSGTSMSCPIVAGVAAMLYSKGGLTLSAQKVRAAIEKSSDPVGNFVTKGRVNLFKALNEITPPVEMDFPATSISLYYGGVTSGDLSSVLASDDVRYRITSQISNVGQAAGAYVTLQVTQLTDMVGLKLKLEGQAGEGSTDMFWLYNWNTGQYDFYKSFPIGTTDTPLTMDVSTTNYMSQSGEVSVITRAHRAGRRPANFIYGIDQVKLTGLYKAP